MRTIANQIIVTCLSLGLLQTACSGSLSKMVLRSVAPEDIKLVLANTPEELSNLSSLDISLSGEGIKQYRYKLGLSENINCANANNYSAPVDIDAKISDSLSSLPDAELRLCVIASNIYDKWQKLTQATEVLWTKDTTAPVVAMSFPNKDGLSVGYKTKVRGSCTTDDGETEIKFTSGTSEVTHNFDCSTGSFMEYIDLSSLEVGTVSLELSQTDAAGNTHAILRTLQKNTSLCDSLAARQKLSAEGFAGGTGELDSPYILCTTDQLNDVRNTANKFFQLGNDLYFEAGDSNGDFLQNGSDTDYTSNEGWLPLPAVEYLEGKSHTIYGLRISRPATDDIGLFGRVTYATIEDLQVIDAQVTGRDNVGILLGINYAAPFHFSRVSLIDSSVNGTDKVGGLVGNSNRGIIQTSQAINLTVSGLNYVGGLIGDAPSAIVQSSKVQGSVSGAGYVGGLIGFRGFVYNSSADVIVTGTANSIGGLSGTFSKIFNSYAKGQVSTPGTHVGCLAGGLGTVINSFAACESVSGSSTVGFVSGQSELFTNNYYSSSMSCTRTSGGDCATHGGTPSSLESFYGEDHPLFTSWDFRSNSTDGQSELWVSSQDSLPGHFFEVPYEFSSGLSGEGTAAQPYLISSTSDLLEVASNPFYQKAHLRMTQNIDLSLAPPGAFKGLFRYLPFEGSFDGGGYRVLNLDISETPDISYNLGFLGIAFALSSVSNLHVQVDTLDGGEHVGAVIGYAHSKRFFEKLGSSGTTIQAASNSGGLIGYCATSLRYAESHIDVQCTGGHCGGLVGWRIVGETTDAFATGNVSGDFRVGGLFGLRQNGTTERTYATGNVTAIAGDAGGLTGANYATTTYSFATGDVSGADASNKVGNFFGHGSNGINYYLNTATCTNPSGGCNSTGTAVGPLSYFHSKANPPLDTWDFDNIWQENFGALPSLRDMP